MKTIHEILTEYGLTVPEDKKAEFDKAVGESYKTAADYDKQAGKLELAEGKVKTAEAALKKFEGIDVTALQGEIATLKTDLATKDTEYQQKVSDMAFTSLLDGAITTAKGKHPDKIKKLLDMDALKGSKNQTEDISKALDALKGEIGGLFEVTQTPPPYASGTGTKPMAPSGAPSDLRSALQEKFTK